MVASKSHDGAVRVLDALEEGFELVAQSPGVGHWRGDLGDDRARVWNVFKYLIIYDPNTKPVEIMRIIHGARDMPTAFRKSSR